MIVRRWGTPMREDDAMAAVAEAGKRRRRGRQDIRRQGERVGRIQYVSYVTTSNGA